jgi:hypothetical protein
MHVFSIEDIAYLPQMSEYYKPLMEILSTMISATYILSTSAGPNLFRIVTSLACKLCIEHGPTGISGNAFACFSGVLSDFKNYNER